MAATTSTWTGAAGGDFADADNWDGGIAPAATDAVSFAGHPGTVTGDGAALSINIGNDAASYPGTWTFLGGSLLAGGEAIAGSLPEAVGFFSNTVLDGETLNASGGTTTIGGPAGVTVTAQGSAQVTTGGDILGGSAAEVGSLVLTGAGTDWIEQPGSVADGSLPGFLILGSLAASSGSLTVDDGAQLVTGGGAVLGADAGSSGSAMIAAASWTASGGVQVGAGGTGTLTVSAGTLATGASTTIGAAAGSSGTVVVAGADASQPGVLTNDGGLVVGGAGTGTLAVGENGVVTTSGDLTLGGNAGGSGVMTVDAAMVAIGGAAAIGASGAGALSVSAGGLVRVNNAAEDPDAVVIGGAASGSLTITDAGSDFAAQGVVAVGSSGNGALVIENDGSLGSTQDAGGTAGIAVGGTGLGIGQDGTLMSGGSGAAELTGGGSMSSAQWIKVGTEGVDGTLTVQDGSTAEAGTQVLIGDSLFVPSGDVIITPNGSVVSSGALVTTSGVVNVEAGGTLKSDGAHSPGAPGIVVGAGVGAEGVLNVTGLGATVDTGGDGLAVGQGGNGQLVISNGAAVLAGTQFQADSAVSLGQNSGAAGYVEITEPGSSLVADGQMDVGESGNGTLLVQNQATVISGGNTLVPGQGLDVGVSTGGSGAVTVTGLGSALSNTGQFVIGDAGTGSLAVENAATVVTDPGGNGAMAAVIANQSSAGGSSVSVTGTGSTWQVGGTLEVGNAAAGALNVADGGTVSADALLAAAQTGGGLIAVTGQGSTLNLTGSLTLGWQSAGELSILDGATVSAGALTIGNAGTLSSGNVDVEGVGSSLQIAGTGVLNIGYAGGGSGVLTIGSGATLSYAGGIVESGRASFNNDGGVIDPDFIEFTTASNAGLGSNAYSLYVGNIGAVQVTSGAGTWVTPMVLTGTSVADAADNIDGNGDIGQWQLSQSGTLILNTNTIDAGQAIVFEDATDTLVIGQIVDGGSPGVSGVEATVAPGAENLLAAGGFDAQIWGYQAGDQILFNNLTIASDSIVSGNTLDLFGADNSLLGELTFYNKAGSHPLGASAMEAAAEQLAPVAPVMCFAAGTRILTQRGEIAVEALREGDPVWSVISERCVPVQWIGCRAVNCRAHPQPRTIWPVRVAAGAFGPGLPRCDLMLSPDHALYLNHVLIPVKRLVNGTTIRQVPVDAVTYYHVELPAHDVLLAEGLPAESYLDVDERASFGNSGSVVALHPNFAAHLRERRWEAEACAPLQVVGPQVEAARALLATRADAAADTHLAGHKAARP